jgi:hypothetical protein
VLPPEVHIDPETLRQNEAELAMVANAPLPPDEDDELLE